MNKSPLTLAFGGLLAMAAGIGIGRFVYTPILPPMVEALSRSKAEAGLIASANFVGYLAGALLAAVRLPGSRRAWLLVRTRPECDLPCRHGGHDVTRAVPGAAARCGHGERLLPHLQLGPGAGPLANAGRSALSALHFSGVGIGIAVSAAVVAMLGDWRSMWLASAALALIAAIAVALLVPGGDPCRADRHPRSSRTRLSPPSPSSPWPISCSASATSSPPPS